MTEFTQFRWIGTTSGAGTDTYEITKQLGSPRFLVKFMLIYFFSFLCSNLVCFVCVIFLLDIILSVLHVTVSDYPFKPFFVVNGEYCLQFHYKLSKT